MHHWLTVLNRIKTWQFIVLLVLFGAVASFLLRQNNLQMVELRAAVMKADEDPAGDTKKALTNLQKYVAAHMNTDLGNGVYLQQTYQRAYTATLQAAANTTNPNSALYTKVELECRAIYNRTHSFPAYTQCADDKLQQLAPGQDALASVKTPNVALYHYNFISPLISFDPAGMFVLVTGVIGICLLFRLMAYMLLKIALRKHHARI